MVEGSAFAVAVAVAAAGTLVLADTSVEASIAAEADFSSTAFGEMDSYVGLSQSAELGLPWGLEELLLLLMTALVGL